MMRFDDHPDDLPHPALPLPRLTRAFYRKPTIDAAKSLLGQLMVRRLDDGSRVSGIIVETEAYLGPEDEAAHTHGGRRSPRNESMWRDGGTAYVYFTYGMHYCINVVTSQAEHPQAVLIRALQPVEGIDAMARRRSAARRVTDLCSGPAKLCQGLQINREQDRQDLVTGESLWLERVRQRALPQSRIASGPRIGIGYAGAWVKKPLRFWVAGNRFVSR